MDALRISTRVKTGDPYDYVVVTIGDVEITIYESVVRPGGVTIEIDAEDKDRVAAYFNDFQLCGE